MGKAPARAVTDSELLSDDGPDDSPDTLDTLDDEAGDRAEDTLIGGEKPTKPAKPEDDGIEVQILDEDEGEDKTAKPEEEEEALTPHEDDDVGEDIEADTPRGELTEWEKKNYNKAIQDRILRERRIKARAVEQAAVESRNARAARAETLEAQKLSTTLLGRLIEGDIKEKEALLETAMEGGVTKDVVKLNGELADLRAKKRDVEVAKARLDQVKPEQEQAAPADSSDTAAWHRRNDRWFKDAQFSDEANYTRMLDQGLADAFKAGRFAHAPGTAPYFTELDRRIHARMPTLRPRIRKVYGEVRRTPSAPVSRGAPSKPTGNKVVLNRADLENMRNFGLDPANQADLKAYAQQMRAIHE